MTRKTHTLLSETNIYVSWGILCSLGVLIWFAAQTYLRVDQIYPLLSEVQNLKTVQVLQAHDISMIKQKLQLYDVEIKP